MISFIIELIVSFLDSIICFYFISSFLRYSFFKCKWNYLAITVYFGITLIGDLYMPGFSTLIPLLLIAASYLFAVLSAPQHPVKALLAICIYEAAYILLASLVYTTISILIDDFDQIMQGSDSVFRYLSVILHKIALCATLKLILSVFSASSSLDIKNGILTFLFTLITLLGLGSTMFFSSLPNVEDVQIQILVINVAFILTNVFLYILISQVQKLQKSKYELKLMEEKMRFEEARYQDATAIWTNVRKAQHDIKQHLTVFSGYLNENRIEECQQYLNRLLPDVDRMGKLIQSDNTILDYLINTKLFALKDTQIIISGNIGDLSDIKETDLACLMGNILDNAIEALENVQEKRIELLFTVQNSNRIIICKNTIAQSVLQTNKELKSTKKRGDSHGWGNLIVAKIVSDYHGMVDYFEEYDMFGVQIVLPRSLNKQT